MTVKIGPPRKTGQKRYKCRSCDKIIYADKDGNLKCCGIIEREAEVASKERILEWEIARQLKKFFRDDYE